MARTFLFTTLFFCFLSLGSSKKKPDKIPIPPISNLATTDIPIPCYDTGCKSYFGDEAECVYVLQGNWSLINNEYKINTDYVPNLCRGSFDDCCRCFRRTRKIITAPPTTTTTTTTPTTTTTTTTTTTGTTPAVGCIDVDGSCGAAFGGAGSCIDVRTGNLTDIDPEVTPLADKCSTGPEKCCQCFKMKTSECCKTVYTLEGDRKEVFHQIDTHNNKPVYKHTHGEYCIYYEEQWMAGKCEGISKGKTGDSKGVTLLSKANVDCPNQIETGDWYNPDGRDARNVSFSCDCCDTLRILDLVLYQTNIHNNRPVYKTRNGGKELCLFYGNRSTGEKWLLRKCQAFYEDPKSLYSRGVEIRSNINVDCPNKIEAGHWYEKTTEPSDFGHKLSFSCECCIAIQYGKEVYYLEDKHNNKPVYKDSKKEYCIYYGKQWMVRTCRTFYKHGDDLYKFDGIELLNNANVDCPNQIGGDMYWYNPGGKEDQKVSFSCVPPNGY